MRRFFPLLLASIGFALSGNAHAGMSIDAQPIFGTQTSSPNGWAEIAVRIDNPDPKPMRGTIELSSTQDYGDRSKLEVHAPFAVDAQSSAIVRLPLHGQGYSVTQTVRLLDEQGQALTSQTLPFRIRPGQLLVDVIPGSRLGAALGDVNVTLFYENGRGSANRQPLTVAQPKWDRQSGDPILPLRAAGFGDANAVLIASDVLVKVQGPELDALTGFALGGGTIAIVVRRSEDLRHPTIEALVGGESRIDAPPRKLLLTPTEGSAMALEEPMLGGLPHSKSPAPMPGLPAPEMAQEPGAPLSRELPPYASPSAEVAERFVGYRGGLLEPSAFGATAPYGLGEVHLLAFDPSSPAALEDDWTHLRLVELVRHASDRRASIVFQQGVAEWDATSFDIHRQLDPNENARWLILVIGLGLLVYAVIAGPLNFSRAAKKGRPLRALFVLPILSAGAFVGILVVGTLAKGIHGRARHLTLIEARAGTERAVARRYRGFFTPRGSELTIRTTDAGSVIQLSANERERSEQKLVVDRDGARLVDVAAMPWETLVVREEGFASLGAGVSITPTEGGDIMVTNRIGRDLRGVIVHVPGESPKLFPRIRDGESVSASTGSRISVRGSPYYAGKIQVTTFDTLLLDDSLKAHVPGLASAWKAVITAAGRNVDWFPDDLPVVLAQLDGGEGTTTDSSLKLESDRALLRVIGFGGMP